MRYDGTSRESKLGVLDYSKNQKSNLINRTQRGKDEPTYQPTLPLTLPPSLFPFFLSSFFFSFYLSFSFFLPFSLSLYIYILVKMKSSSSRDLDTLNVKVTLKQVGSKDGFHLFRLNLRGKQNVC